MSWFFIQCGPSSLNKATPLGLPFSQHEFRSESLNVRAGGPEPTCIFYSDPANSRGFVVCGTGLIDEGDKVKIMRSEDWQYLLFHEDPQVQKIEGHFACFVWSPEGYRAFNDQLGIREVVYTTNKNEVTLSTHLVWITKTRSANQLDPSAFGGKWYLAFQCDHRSWITGIERLGPHGSATISRSYELQVNRYTSTIDYTLRDDKTIGQELTGKISRFTLFPFENGHSASLSLSGGVDSRIVLAALRQHTDWDAFTFGLDSDADVKVSRILAQGLNFPQYTIPPAKIALSEAEEMVAITDLFKPASASYAHLSYHSVRKSIVLDGAPGELLRRRLFTKLEYLGGSALENGDWEAITPYLWTERPSFWNRRLAELMRNGARQQVMQCVQALPSARSIGKGNWIDTFFTHLWFANVSGADQRRLDGILLCTSPFSQPSTVRLCFQAREGYRKHGHLATDILKQLDPEVLRYPYAKDELVFPAWTPWYLSKLYGKLMKRRSPVQTDTERFLTQFRTEILDTLASREVRECDLYDYASIVKNVNAYYAGENQHAAFVDWWFSFELWRRACNVTSFSEA